MKPPPLRLFLLPWLLSAGPLAAFPYSPRPVIIGMDTATVAGSGGFRTTPTPMAASFDGGHEQQWYAGGSLMTNAPWPGSLQLPAILLPQTPTATVRPLAAAVCDVDRDGDMDVVRINEWIGNLYIYTLQVFVNSGAGSFATGYRLDWVNAPGWNEGQHFFAVAAADFNRDGRPDLAIQETYNNTNTAPDPDREEGRLIIRWNGGPDGFDTATIVKSTGLDAKSRLSVADYDRDGDPDLTCSHDVTWEEDDATFHHAMAGPQLYRNDGAQVFTKVDLGARPAQLVDLNRDGWPDLADSQAVALNDGTGGFAAEVKELAAAVEAYTFADTNHDGRPDLVRCEGTSLVSYAGNGNGGFASTSQLLAALGGTGIALASADSDSDGDGDFFVTLAAGGFVFVENHAFHSVPGAGYVSRVPMAGVTQLLTGDFFRDGRPDLLAVTPAQEKLWFLNGTAGYSFNAPVFKNTQSEAAHSAVVADFNADGLPDVGYTLPDDGEVRVAQNTAGDVPFTWPDAAAATGLPGVSQLASGYRSSRDGFPDLLSSSATTGQLRWHYQSGAAWATQSILDPFSPAPGAILTAQAGIGPGDEMFVLTTNASQLKLRAYQFTFGIGSLGTDRTEGVSNGPHATRMVHLDTNGDGTEEIVYVSGNGGLGSWNALTASPSSLPGLPAAIRDLTPVDWDRDGRPDLLCATSAGLYLLFYNHRDYAWNPVLLYPNTVDYQAVTTADFDQDGWPDAAVSTSDEIFFYRNLRLPGIARQDSNNRSLTVGSTGQAATWTLTTQARQPGSSNTAEPGAVCTGVTLKFSRAQSISGSWVPGTPLTQTELSSLVSSVRLVAGDNHTVIGSAAPGALQSQGILQVDYHAVFGNLVPITTSGTGGVDHSIQFTVRPDALESGHSRLFIQALGFSGAPQDGLTPIAPGEGQLFRLRDSRAAMVTFEPVYTPLQSWRRFYWNSPASTGDGANDADPDHDGVANLVEYVTGTNPLIATPATNGLRALTVLSLPNSQSPVRLRLILGGEALADPTVKITLRASPTPGAWNTLTSRTGGGAWTQGITPQTIDSDYGTTTTHLFTLPFTAGQVPRQFFSLKVEELP